MIKDLPPVSITGDTDPEIKAIEYDSRLVREATLFFAIRGFRRDGYDFVPQAREKGAVAVMGERNRCDDITTHVQVPDIRSAMADVAARFYGYPGNYLNIFGVTGTNGKTTTCHLIQRILRNCGRGTGLVTSTVYDTGKETFPAERTTPESLDLQRLLLLMKKNRCQNAVIEVSSHALVLKRVEKINFRVAVFTNFTRDHLDFHQSMEEYLRAKGLLLTKLENKSCFAVINIDVSEFRSFLGSSEYSYISYSLNNSAADVYCRDYQLDTDRTIFNLVTPEGTRTVRYRLPGRFNLVNALAAAAAGLAGNVNLDDIINGLETAQPIPGRFQALQVGQPFAVYIDFAHTPDAIERLCLSARDISRGKLLLLFGCGGNRDRGKRPLMGQAAGANADYVVLTSDNPRDEDPEDIIRDIKPGLKGSQYEICPDRQQAIRTILGLAQPGDTVLIAGKGAENHQEIKGERFLFDDLSEARTALAGLGYSSLTCEEEH